jgi:hypothetical protein
MMRLRLCFACTLLATSLAAHDLEENRATLVLRDGTHLSLSLYLNYTEALHKALMPQREYGAFLLVYSAMKPDDLKRELLRAQAKFEAGIQFMPKSPGPMAPLRAAVWTWPDTKQVQTMLQHQVMQAMVDGHVHEPPTEIHADFVSGREIVAVTVRFPEEFQKVLVVSYRPQQAWADGGTLSPEVKF